MKHSKQRDIILNNVKNRCDHPDAYMIYEDVKKIVPDVSLGTIYRNLNLLSELGLIKKIIVPEGNDRYDKTLINHSHIYCSKCENIYDMDICIDDFAEKIEKTNNFKIVSYDVVFTGICRKCLEEDGNYGIKRK